MSADVIHWSLITNFSSLLTIVTFVGQCGIPKAVKDKSEVGQKGSDLRENARFFLRQICIVASVCAVIGFLGGKIESSGQTGVPDSASKEAGASSPATRPSSTPDRGRVAPPTSPKEPQRIVMHTPRSGGEIVSHVPPREFMRQVVKHSRRIDSYEQQVVGSLALERIANLDNLRTVVESATFLRMNQDNLRSMVGNSAVIRHALEQAAKLEYYQSQLPR